MPADKEFKADIFQRTSAQWTAEDPYLSENDLYVESDTGKMKLGGGQKWSDTSYLPSVGSHTHVSADITDFSTAVASAAKKFWWM